MKEYDLNLFLVDKDLHVIQDALALYIKTAPFGKAMFADNVREKFYEAIEDAGVREI